MIEILGRRNSANVQKVMWTLGELGVDYQRYDTGGSFGFPADYPNPNQVVPTLRDGAITVWESNACVRHLARTYGQGSLWPSDPGELAVADMWMEWQRSDISNHFFALFQMLIRGMAATPEKIARHVEGCGQAFAQLDAQLANHDFIVGPQITMADMAIGAMMYRYMTLDIERPSLPNLEAWYQRLTERSTYQHHVMLEYGSNVEEWNVHEAANANIQ